jgi:hypothetical protein
LTVKVASLSEEQLNQFGELNNIKLQKEHVSRKKDQILFPFAFLSFYIIGTKDYICRDEEAARGT